MQGSGRRKTAHSPPTSDELIEIYRTAGRPEDFQQIVERFAALVLSECRRATGNAHDAEDASQLAFLALAIAIRSGTSFQRVSAWLQRVARRQASKIVRARGRQRRREDAVRRNEIHLSDLDTPMDAAVTSGIIRDAIDQLPERYRLPVILHYFGGMSLERVADELKLKRQAVATRLHRGRKMLAERLSRRGLRLENGTLASIMTVFVPMAVVKNVLGAAKGISSAPTNGVTTTLAASITEMLRMAALTSLRRPLRIAVLLAVMTVATSGMAWVVGPGKLGIEQLKKLDPRGWFHTVPKVKPELELRVSAPPTDPVAPPHELVIKTAPAITARPVTPVAMQAAPPAPTRSEASPAQVRVPAVSSFQTPSPQPMPLTNLRFPVATPAPAAPRSPQAMAQQNVVIGDAGNAQLALRDDQRLEVQKLTLGAQPGSRGTLNVGGGSVVVGSGGVTVGDKGSGKLILGNATAPGQIRTAPGRTADFTIRAAPGAKGIVQGHGAIATGGTLTNNGQVIGDGQHHTRQLDLTNFGSVVSNLSNPIAYGDSGWFVQRGGQVLLPSIAVDPGTHTYTWGESKDADTINLVNSLRLTVHDQPQPATVAIRLRTVALADPLDLALPDQTAVIGLWQFDSTSTFAPADLDVLVRYNDAAAQTFAPGEGALRLIAYTGNNWQIASGLSLDTIRNHIAGRFDEPFRYLAVGVPFDAQAGLTPQSFQSQQDPIVPEPTALGLLAAALLLLPRRH